jgi:hypothetical protein
MSDIEPFKRKVKYVIRIVLLIIIVALLAIIAFSALFAFLFHTNVIETTSTSKIITTIPTQMNVNFHANIWFDGLSKIDLSLSNHDNRPYHFVKLEITDAQSGTIVYTLKIDVTLLSNGFTSFSISIPPTIQQGRTYIITLYTDDGYKTSTTVG